MIQKFILAGISLTCLLILIFNGQDILRPANNAIVSATFMPAGSSMAMTADSVNHSQRPDSISGTNLGCLQETEPDLFRMPIFKPDSSLTASMPVIIPPPVDEDMIVPFGTPSPKKCE